MTTDVMPRNDAAPGKRALAILSGGFAAGLFDIIFASVLSGARPDRVFKYIAAGWVGLPAARAGGFEMVVLGAASHFGLAITFAAFFVLMSRALPVLRRQWVIFGLLYGASLHVFMNTVVVPLSALHRDPFAGTLENYLINMAGQSVLFGLPIAYAAKRFVGSN
ncbi:MAG TPA: hypothetical protein VGG10_23155 [Rhizomicrobium sp.]|jgi:hypothetical protein